MDLLFTNTNYKINYIVPEYNPYNFCHITNTLCLLPIDKNKILCVIKKYIIDNKINENDITNFAIQIKKNSIENIYEFKNIVLLFIDYLNKKLLNKDLDINIHIFDYFDDKIFIQNIYYSLIQIIIDESHLLYENYQNINIEKDYFILYNNYDKIVFSDYLNLFRIQHIEKYFTPLIILVRSIKTTNIVILNILIMLFMGNSTWYGYIQEKLYLKLYNYQYNAL